MLVVILNIIAVAIIMGCVWFIYQVLMALREWRKVEKAFLDSHTKDGDS